MISRRAACARISTLLALAACGCGGDVDDPGLEGSKRALASIIATLSSGTSGLQVKRRPEAFWESAGIGTPFLPGDWVQTGPDDHCRIQFVRGGRVDLDPSAIVVVDEQLLEDSGKEVLLSVEAGVVRGELRDPTQAVGIRAPDGTTARLRANAGSGPVEYRLSRRARATEVTIRKGVATLSSRKARREVRAGQVAEVSTKAPDAVIVLPPPPPLASPGAGASLVAAEGESVRLEWGLVPQAAGYRVQVSSGEDFLDLAATADTQLPQQAFQPPAEAVFHWRVASVDGDGRAGEFGPARIVRIYRPLAEDALVEPENGTRYLLARGKARVIFRWNERPGARYRLRVSRGAGLDGPKVLDEVRAESRAILPLAPGEYAWGVYALEGDGGVRPLFAQPWTFAIARSGPGVRLPRAIRKWGE